MLALLQRDGVKLLRSSDHFMCLCPFHREKSPSCHVWEDHLHCYGCATHVDAIEYIRKTRSVGFLEAVELLGGNRYVVPEYRPTPAKPRIEEPTQDFSDLCLSWLGETSEHQVSDLAAKLGVGEEPLWWLGVAWAKPHNAWAFPMRDARQNIIGVRLRDNHGKKWAVKGSKQGLFIPSIDTDKRLFVCEGPTDCAACLSMGFYAIGRPSCNGCLEMVLDFLKANRSISEVVLVTDNDEAGLRGSAALRKEIPVRSYELLLAPKDIRKFVQLGGGNQFINSLLANQVPWRGKGR